MNNTIFYLIGHPDLPKPEVAAAIAALTGAKVVNAQDIYAPIFRLLDDPNPAALPDAAWEQIDVVRGAVLKTIETLSPKDWNFVFTHAGFDIPADVGVYRTVRDMAKRRSARFLPARLLGGKSKRPLLKFDESNVVEVDLEHTAPAEAAKAIVAAAGKP